MQCVYTVQYVETDGAMYPCNNWNHCTKNSYTDLPVTAHREMWYLYKTFRSNNE